MGATPVGKAITSPTTSRIGPSEPTGLGDGEVARLDEGTFPDPPRVMPAAEVTGVPTISPALRKRVETAIARVGTILTENLTSASESCVFSAPGVTALMMFAANGTEPGAQRDAYLKALGFEGVEMSEVNRAAAALADELKNLGEGITVSIANLAVANPEKVGGFTAGFKAGASEGPPLNLIDQPFVSFEQTASDINKWVSDNTGEMIGGIVTPEVISELLWGLFSAIAFEGIRTVPFVDVKELLNDPKFAVNLDFETQTRETNQFRADVATYLGLEDPYDLYGTSLEDVRAELETAQAKAGAFTRPDGTKTQVNKMKLESGGLRFPDFPDCRAVMLPYGKQQGAFMVVMLPNEGVTPTELLSKVGTDSFLLAISDALPRPEDAKDVVWMPRFRTDFEPETQRVLETLGRIAPLRFGDLTLEGPQSPNGAVLVASIENGPKAARAGQVAGVAALECFHAPPPPRTLDLDRPFAYAIITADSNTALFQGTYCGET